MLPDSGQDQNNRFGASARYGAYAMEILINQLLKMGAKRGNFEAKSVCEVRYCAVLPSPISAKKTPSLC